MNLSCKHDTHLAQVSRASLEHVGIKNLRGGEL